MWRVTMKLLKLLIQHVEFMVSPEPQHHSNEYSVQTASDKHPIITKVSLGCSAQLPPDTWHHL